MDPTTKRRLGLALAILAIGAAIVVIEAPWKVSSEAPPPPQDIPEAALEYQAAPNFAGGTGWVQSEPLDLVELRGQVVLVDFWTYSCINCIHTFPYLKDWHAKYEDDGLVIVGVHTPEFRFERERENVQAAADRYGLEWAIVQDNDYDIWNAYHNRYWPAKYLIDQWGRIRYTHFGEGAYDETEAKIRELLVEAGANPTDELGGVTPEGGFGSRGQTPELFAGAAQGLARVGIGNEEGYEPGRTITYAEPDTIEQDLIFLVGTWANEEDHVRAVGPARVLLNFSAGAANVVADGPHDACVRFTLDGEGFPEDRAARDLSFGPEGACVWLDSPRSYDFYAGPVERHLVELDVPDGMELYSFAFSLEGRT